LRGLEVRELGLATDAVAAAACYCPPPLEAFAADLKPADRLARRGDFGRRVPLFNPQFMVNRDVDDWYLRCTLLDARRCNFLGSIPGFVGAGAGLERRATLG